MSINFPVTTWFISLLLLIVASGAGTLARWIGIKLDAKDWLCFFVGLFFFGLVILFVKVS